MLKSKQLYLLFFIFFLFGNVTAQKWFPIGAKWYYNYIPSDANELIEQGKDYNHYFTYEVEKDTIIEGKTCQKLKSQYHRSTMEIIDWESQYVRYDEDSNKVYHYWDNEFHVLYDFTLSVGDTFESTLYSYPHKYYDESYGFIWKVEELIVDTIYYEEINGELYKKYLFINNEVFGHYSYSEKLGSTNLLFGMPGDILWMNDYFPLPPGGSLRCYEDTEVLFIYDTRWSFCDYLNQINTSSILQEYKISSDNGRLYVESQSNKSFHLSIHNIRGQLIRDFKDIRSSINVSLKDELLIFITISDSDSGDFISKMIKL